jgi:hypothetical protein
MGGRFRGADAPRSLRGSDRGVPPFVREGRKMGQRSFAVSMRFGRGCSAQGADGVGKHPSGAMQCLVNREMDACGMADAETGVKEVAEKGRMKNEFRKRWIGRG